MSVSEKKPTLVIIPIELKNDNSDKEEKDKLIDNLKRHNQIVFGFAIGFPGEKDSKKARYKLNQVKIDELTRVYKEDEYDGYDE